MVYTPTLRKCAKDGAPRSFVVILKGMKLKVGLPAGLRERR